MNRRNTACFQCLDPPSEGFIFWRVTSEWQQGLRHPRQLIPDTINQSVAIYLCLQLHKINHPEGADDIQCAMPNLLAVIVT